MLKCVCVSRKSLEFMNRLSASFRVLRSSCGGTNSGGIQGLQLADFCLHSSTAFALSTTYTHTQAVVAVVCSYSQGTQCLQLADLPLLLHGTQQHCSCPWTQCAVLLKLIIPPCTWFSKGSQCLQLTELNAVFQQKQSRCKLPPWAKDTLLLKSQFVQRQCAVLLMLQLLWKHHLHTIDASK